MSRFARTERGSAILGAVIWLAVTAALVVGLGRVHVAQVDRARAQTAADAAALAGAAATDETAAEAAERNGAELVELTRLISGSTVEVEVRVAVGEATAVARAERYVRP